MNLKTVALTTGLGAACLLTGAVTSHAAEVTHEVQPGDTLFAIAQNYTGNGDDFQAIANVNGISNPDLINVGQVLVFDTDNLGSPVYTENTEEDVYYEAPVEEAVTYDDVSYEESGNNYDYNEPTYEGSSSSAKEWIAERESSGSYDAYNGHHIGRYQLDPGHFNANEDPWNPADQEAAADRYVSGRYGSWEAAQDFWMNNGWY